MSEPRNSNNSGSTAPSPGVVRDVQEANAQYLLPAERQIPKGYKQTEVGVIPEDWVCTTVGQLVSDSVLEKPLDGNHGNIHPKSGDFVSFGIPFVMANNVHDGVVDLSSCAFIRKEQADSLQKGFARQGDVLLTHKATIGNTAVVGELQFDYIMLTPQVTYYRVADEARLSNYYLRHFFDSNTFQSVLQLMSGGGTRAYIGITAQLSLPVTLPATKAEQEAIAEALSDADALIEALEQLVAKKRQLKLGAMQELLTGKRRLPGFSEEWEIKLLGEIGESIIGLTYSPNDVRADGVLVLRSSNVQEGALSFQDNVYVELEISERIMVRAGDILICVRNGSRDLIGKCAKIDDKCKGMTFGAFMSVFRTPFHNFVFHQFQSNVIKRQINEHLGATINQITNKSLNSFQIPFPKDETEQTAIAQILSDMDAEITELETNLTKARAVKQGMMQQLLTGKIRLV